MKSLFTSSLIDWCTRQKPKLEIKALQIWVHGIMLLLTLIELKGETPLFGRDDVGKSSLLVLSLALNFTKTTTSSSMGDLPILVWHLSFIAGSLACSLLSSILVPRYLWVIFFLYALPFSVAPSKPLSRILRLSRLLPSDTDRDDDFIVCILEERPLHHPSTLVPFDVHDRSSSCCNPFEDPFGS